MFEERTFIDMSAIVIAIIGILVPVSYYAFLHYLLKRQKSSEQKTSDAVDKFMLKLQAGHAAELIDKRRSLSQRTEDF